mmetsp:Transcript_48211/g.94619  ORF Transcript_48211/g.94619 Transcript_48211/m.94619 type:complete len:234 (-) Transcript_48211:60-761(-)
MVHPERLKMLSASNVSSLSLQADQKSAAPSNTTSALAFLDNIAASSVKQDSHGNVMGMSGASGHKRQLTSAAYLTGPVNDDSPGNSRAVVESDEPDNEHSRKRAKVSKSSNVERVGSTNDLSSVVEQLRAQVQSLQKELIQARMANLRRGQTSNHKPASLKFSPSVSSTPRSLGSLSKQCEGVAAEQWPNSKSSVLATQVEDAHARKTRLLQEITELLDEVTSIDQQFGLKIS